MSSARVRQIVNNVTAGLEQRLQRVERQPESIRKKGNDTATKTRAHEIKETPVKQLKDVKESIENGVEDVEVVEKELGRERDQMQDLEKMQEEPKNSLEKSSGCNNSTVLNETACYENEVAVDRALNALESDDVPVSSLDRQENMGFLDRATPLLEPTQPKSEGKFFCAYTSGNYMPAVNGRHFLLNGPVYKLIVLESTKECDVIISIEKPSLLKF